MLIGIVEVDPTAAVAVIDLPGLASTRVGIGGYVAVQEPAVSGIKGGVVDQEGDMHRSDLGGVVVVVEPVTAVAAWQRVSAGLLTSFQQRLSGRRCLIVLVTPLVAMARGRQ